METETSMQTDQLASLLAQWAEANRADLISSYRSSLQENLFSNRTVMRPREVGDIAVEEADALIRSFSHPFEAGREHGAQLCQKGFSDQTILSLGQATRQFFLTRFTSAEIAQVFNIIDLYQNGVAQGFIKAQEQVILLEQEQIRGAMQIAIGRYTVEIKEVQSLAQRATEANEFKTRFIARISHELRTPLGALLGMSEMLQASVYGPLTPAQLDITQRIINNTRVLEQVFTELLDQSRIESGQLRLKLEEFSPKILAQGVHSNNLPLALQKGLAMHIEIDPTLPDVVIGDSTRIEQILSNLVVNAIKYTQSGEIRIYVRNRDNTHWLMQVKDTGIGISEEDQAHIFEPFRQVDESVGRKFGGVGLGLSIVRQLVRAMDGTVGVESKLGQGSTFTVALPLFTDRRTAPILS